MARLILEHNSKVLKDYSLAKKSLTIGRHLDNTIVLDDLGVSGFHARIDKTGVDYILTDLQSTNGTLLNDENIVSHRLSHGDRIMIGEHAILFIGTEMARAYEEENGLDLNMTTIRGASQKRRPRPKPRTIERKEIIATERKEITAAKDKRPRFLKRLAPVLLGILILIGGGWYIFNYKPALVKNIFSASILTEGNEGVTKIQPNDAESNPLIKEPSPRSSLQLHETSESIKKDLASLESSENQEPSSNQSSDISEEKEQTAFNETDEPDFYLEGIVMASEPKDSFAVINGRMVRAGGTVDGATIVKITKRYVIIRYPKAGSETELTLR